jgi:DNA-binding helix-hairpin-helix protein with protein kinase domain
MIRAGLAKKSPLTAFPIALARRRNGEFLGFTMRLVPDHRPLHDLYAPGSRKHNFPQADFRFLVRSAANVARAIASVHHSGCVIGDINHSSILISKKATIALIDADSFQVSEGTQVFGCLVGVDQYTPPELQGKKLSEVVRTPNHDAFGLAVVVFLLLFMGRHPFSGSPRKGDPPSYEDAIRDFRFVYTEKRDVGMDQPPGTPVLSDFSSDIASAFEKAFSREHASSRPTAMEWVRTLDALEKSLVQCDKNKLHYMPGDAASCPWCDMEERLATLLFVPYIPDAKLVTQPIDLGAGGFNIDAVWLKITSVGDVSSLQRAMPRIAPASVAPSPELATSKNRFATVFWARLVAVGLAAVAIFASAELWWIWLPLALYAAFAGKGQVRQNIDPAPHLKRYIDIERRWQTEIAKWNARCGTNDLVALRASLEAAKNDYKGLHAEEKRRMDFYRSVRKARQLLAFLDGFLIRNSKIKGIGPAKLATLASFGIESAADVSSEKLQRVPGFGPVNSSNLLTWRSTMEGRFVYREQPTDTDRQELTRINMEMQAKGAQLRRLLIPGAENLSRLAGRLRAASEMEDPMLNRLHHELEQAKCNLQFLGVALPDAGSIPTAHISAASRLQRAAPSTASGVHCPRCGSAMVRRTASRGLNVGSEFWGCSRFPQCRGTRN